MSGYKLVLLKDMLHEIGDDDTSSVLSSFSCPNLDVEKFLKEKAVIFEKQLLSSTYLVFASYKKESRIAGYFNLANKQFTVSDKSVRQKNSRGKTKGLSKTLLKKIRSFGAYDKISDVYTIPAPLIGQLGRNFASDVGKNKLITGDELLKIACDRVWEAQRLFSGRIVYLECEDIPKLTEFYERNGFVEFGKRPLDYEEKDDMTGEYLVQMLKDLKPKSK